MRKPVIFKDVQETSTFMSLRWLGCGLDFLHKKNSLTLIQFGRTGKGRVRFLAFVPGDPDPVPNFLYSWHWRDHNNFLNRIFYGVTTKPVRRKSEKRVQVRRRTGKRSGLARSRLPG